MTFPSKYFTCISQELGVRIIHTIYSVCIDMDKSMRKEGNILLRVDCQQWNVERMKKLESHYSAIIIIDLGSHHKWMLKLAGGSLWGKVYSLKVFFHKILISYKEEK